MPFKSALFNWTAWCQVLILLALCQVCLSANSRATCEDGTTKQFFDHFVNGADLSPQPQTGNYRVIPNYFVHQTHAHPEVKRADPQPTIPDKHAAASVATPHSTPQVQLLPYHLAFHERPICLASIEYIDVLNLSDKDELHIFSVASESAHFHASFKHTVLPPRANLSIPVVFLAKVLGPAETSLVIQTNLGGFIYQVSGVGVPNQYAVEPLVGVKVLVQHWYSAPIALYNPYHEPLTVKEVFTSGGFLHLSLPGTAAGTPLDNRRLWELTPYQRKQIINLDFQAANAGKYQGFIYIKTDRDMLIVHVEVTVVKSALQLTLDELDFGALTALHARHGPHEALAAPQSRSIALTLLNGHAHPVHVYELTLSALQNDPNIAAKIDLKIDFHGPLDLAPLTSRDIGTVTFSAKVEGVYRGKLAVKTNDTAQARIELPFKARVIGGHVLPELASTTFAISAKGAPYSAVVQPIQLTNRLNTPFTVLTAELHDPLFRITQLTPVSSVPVNGTWSGVAVSFTANGTQSHRAELVLRTNITALHVPLTSYSGRLHCALAAAPHTPLRVLAFGVLSVGETTHKKLLLHNPNPVAIAVLQINSDLAGLAVTLEHVTDSRGETEHVARVLNSGPRAKGELKEALFSIESNSSAVLSVALASSVEEQREGRMHIRTSHETMRLNVSYHALHGQLRIEPHSLTFDEPAFPGLRLHHSIMAHNSFARAINISHMHTTDPRFIPVVEKRVVEPNVMTKIGYLTFDPALAPHHYMPHTDAAASGALTAAELEARQSLEAMWQHVLDEHAAQITAQLTVHTDVAVTPVLDVHASLTRPSVLHSDALDYGLTQLHTQRTQYIVLHNPSDHPVHVQLLPLAAEAPWWTRVLAWVWSSETAEFYYAPACVTAALIAPHKQVKLGPLVYVPHHLDADTLTLTVRNNLTVYEQIHVRGQGGSGHLALHQAHGAAAAASLGAVVLHLDANHLARCSRGSTSGINVTHSFQIVNDGTLPLKIDALGIDTNSCETEDFKLHSCHSFSLAPAQVHNLTLTFTPDFSAATVRRDLVLFTDQGTYSFPLVAHMPATEVQLCAEVQAPHSAQVAHTARTLFIAFCFCMFVFFVVIIVQEYRYQPLPLRFTDKTSVPDIEQDSTTKRPAPVLPPSHATTLHPTAPTPTTPKSPSKPTRDRRETLPEPALTLPSMTLESSHVTHASTPLTTTSASPKKAATSPSATNAPNTSSAATKNRGRSNSKGQRGKVDPQAPFTITTAVPVTPTPSTEHKSKPAKSRATTDTAVVSVEATPAVTSQLTPLSATAVNVVSPAGPNTALTPLKEVPAVVTKVPVTHTTLTPATPVTSVTPTVPPVTPAVTLVTSVTPVTASPSLPAQDKPAGPPVREDRPPRAKNNKPPNNNLPPYHRGPKRSPKSWVRKDEKKDDKAAPPEVKPVEPSTAEVKSDSEAADAERNSTTIAKKEFVKNMYKPAARVTGVKTPSPSHSPDTNAARTEGSATKPARKTPLPVSPILTTPALNPYATPSLESAASEFSYLEHYYPELEGTELVYNNIAALTGTAHNSTAATAASFNTNLAHTSPHLRGTMRDPFGFAALDQFAASDPRISPAQPRAHAVQPPPHGTIGSVKPRAFDPWDRPVLFDLDGDDSAHVPSNSPPSQFTVPHSPPREPVPTWSDSTVAHTSPSLFTALPPLFAAPSQHSFFSSPTFPRVSKSSDDVITPPRTDTASSTDSAPHPLSTSVSGLTAYNPFHGGSLFAMSESPFTPFAPHPHTSSFGSFNLQNLSQLRNHAEDALDPTHDD